MTFSRHLSEPNQTTIWRGHSQKKTRVLVTFLSVHILISSWASKATTHTHCNYFLMGERRQSICVCLSPERELAKQLIARSRNGRILCLDRLNSLPLSCLPWSLFPVAGANRSPGIQSLATNPRLGHVEGRQQQQVASFAPLQLAGDD